MDETPQLHERETDPDAIRRVARSSRARAAALAAAAAVVVLAAYVAMHTFEPPADDAPPRPATASATDHAPGVGAKRATVRAIRVDVERGAAAKASPPPSDTGRSSGESAAGVPEIGAGEYIAALRAAGETEGLAAFPPPGTRPPEPGVVVPDDYELPEGFMRHYQSTDDGRQLEPVLTLAPGYELVDENGNPHPLGRDRIVPPELAPPDLPVRILDVPSRDRPTRGTR